MSSKPGLYPQKIWRSTSSDAEKKVYSALKTELPKGWYAWHSLKVRSENGFEGEGDFVFAIPKVGLLVLEVKGGNITVEDGHWFQNGNPMKESPREQGHRFKRLLLTELAKRDCYPPAHGIATCFPDTLFDNPPSQADLNNTVLGMQEIKWLKESLPGVCKTALPEPKQEKGDWIKVLHSMWGEVWRPSAKLGTKLKYDEDERLILDAQQIEILNNIDSNRRILVEGSAGTGKTMLAMEKSIRLSRQGKKVLFLSFTDGLAKCVEARVNNFDITVTTIRRMASSLLLDAGIDKIAEDTSDYWNNVCLRAAEEALPLIKKDWDAIIIDEGQDFADEEWLFVDELNQSSEYFWVFCDVKQAFWKDRELPDFLKDSFRYNLPNNYRCPKPIISLAEGYLGEPINLEEIKKAQSDGIILITSCPSESSIKGKVEIEIDKLLGEGLSPSDIAILTLRGKDAILDFKTIGRHKTVFCDDGDITSNIIADSFLRFKGLERAAIIIVGLELVKTGVSNRMYIALTRALTAVRIISDKKTITNDKILSDLI